jgi:hypothetical protein
MERIGADGATQRVPGPLCEKNLCNLCNLWIDVNKICAICVICMCNLQMIDTYNL